MFTSLEVLSEFGRFDAEGFLRLTIPPDRLLRVTSRDNQLVIAVELNNNVWQFGLGDPSLVKFSQISTTPSGLPVYKLIVEHDYDYRKWRFVVRGVVREPEDLELMAEIARFYSYVES
jgi:hypothetical protein